MGNGGCCSSGRGPHAEGAEWQGGSLAPLALVQDVDRLFESLVCGWGVSPLAARSAGFVPRADVAEDDQAIRVTAELPGVKAEDLEVSVDGDTLIIRGEKKTEQAADARQASWSERTYGAFARAFTLPAEVDRERVEAAFKQGVLTLTLPKTAQTQHSARRIDVKSE